MLKVAFGTVGVLAMAMLAGCAGTPAETGVEAAAPSAPAVQYTFQDPDDVPQERWSEAMRIARAMGIEGGLKDVVAPEGVSVTPQGEAVMASQGVDPLVGGVLGAASPTTHVSSGASLALGATFFVLGNAQATAPYMFDNVAFWVPESMAANAEEASSIATKAWYDARVKAFSTDKFREPRTANYPKGHNSYRGESVKNMLSLKNIRHGAVAYEGELKTMNLGGMSGKYYGPIFIMDGDLHTFTDRTDYKLDYSEYYSRMAKSLPAWAAIYFSPKHGYENRQRVVKAGPVVVHNGEVLKFVVQDK